MRNPEDYYQPIMDRCRNVSKEALIRIIGRMCMSDKYALITADVYLEGEESILLWDKYNVLHKKWLEIAQLPDSPENLDLLNKLSRQMNSISKRTDKVSALQSKALLNHIDKELAC